MIVRACARMLDKLIIQVQTVTNWSRLGAPKENLGEEQRKIFLTESNAFLRS